MNYGILSLLPPIIAVILAIKSKNVILSLFCGGFAGVMIFSHGNPFLAVKSMIGDYLFVQLTDSYNAGVIVLIIFIGGFIKLMECLPLREYEAEGPALRLGGRHRNLFLRSGHTASGRAGVSPPV